MAKSICIFKLRGDATACIAMAAATRHFPCLRRTAHTDRLGWHRQRVAAALSFLAARRAYPGEYEG